MKQSNKKTHLKQDKTKKGHPLLKRTKNAHLLYPTKNILEGDVEVSPSLNRAGTRRWWKTLITFNGPSPHPFTFLNDGLFYIIKLPFTSCR